MLKFPALCAHRHTFFLNSNHMEWIAEAFERKWFYIGAIIVSSLYGLGGLIHIGNVVGFGEMKWIDSPTSWRVGDLWWGTLDMVAVVGVAFKSPIGIVALLLAATSQIVMYGYFPQLVALTDAHNATLRTLVYFNGIVVVVASIALWIAGNK